MPGLARKVLVAAAVDGLLLHPLNPVPSKDGSRPPPLPLVKIKYGSNVSVSTVGRDHAPPATSESFEAYGVVGLSLSRPTIFPVHDVDAVGGMIIQA